MMRVRLSGFALLLLILVASAATGIGGPVTPPRSADVDVHATETILTFPVASAGTGVDRVPLGAAVALPRNATVVTAHLISGKAGLVETVGKVMSLRGRPVVSVRIDEPGDGTIVVAVRHNGDWSAKASDRLDSEGLDAALPGAQGPAGLKSADPSLGGSYVVITAPQYASSLAPLVAWKTAKGWPVVEVTTDVTGTANDAIRAWLQDAYDTWDRPPEYVLLVGDVDLLPAWSFSGNVTDLPYSLLDGDDWLPDVMLGRFSVSNESECQAIVAKTVAYEQAPYTDNPAWFTRGVMIAGQYSSSTPMHTVRFCGEQLESIGFDPLDPVIPVVGDEGNYIVSPYIPSEGVGIPQNWGPDVIKTAIDTGCSIVAYRGWAYGTAGWEPPHYTVNEIPALANGAMTPVVMSFVCLNGDFSAAAVCFGEVFTRVGGATPAEFKGAVAFIGNGEHWSHTRFNDAMAIASFERIVDPGVTTLGGLLDAGKLRFMEYFPAELDETGNEESVEFYFHIYLLLGDPELNFYHAMPTALDVVHAADLPIGTSLIEVAVNEAGEPTPLAGARVGIVQSGQLLGAGLSGDDGRVRIVLETGIGDGPVGITVTHPDRLAYQGQVNGTESDVFLGLSALVVDDSEPAPGSGNGDGAANPGESLALTPTLLNSGTQASTNADVELTVDGPATVTVGASTVNAIAAGTTGEPLDVLIVAVDADAEDGAVIRGRLDVQHGIETNSSGFELTVSAPDLVFSATDASGNAWVDPGETEALTVTVTNNGSLGTTGGMLEFQLTEPDGVELVTNSIAFGAVAVGSSTICGPVSLELGDEVPAGLTLSIQVTATCDEGAVQTTSLPVPVGSGNVTEPAGPDGYGYYAYDSADYLYPDQRPVYRWLELSTEFGGSGTKLDFVTDNYDREITVDLPFPFRFYGQDFNRIRVSDNGWVSFDDTDDFYNFYNWPIPSAHGNGAVVAPFWDNLTPEPAADPENDPVGMDSDGVYWAHVTDDGADEFVLEWSRMRHYKPEITDLQTFQLVLRNPVIHETLTGDGEILFFYKQVADNDHERMHATVGIESLDEIDGLQLTYDGIRRTGTLAFGPGQAIRITTTKPVRQPLAVTGLAQQDNGGVTHLSWQLDDPRPVLGWRVFAIQDGQRIAMAEAPLPAAARSWDTPTTGDELVLQALLPYGGTADIGRPASAGPFAAFSLGVAVPNPVRSESSIAFSLPAAGPVRLRVFDVRGRLVRTLFDGAAATGQGVVVWQGRDDRGHELADGVYFYRLEHAGNTLTRKLLLVH